MEKNVLNTDLTGKVAVVTGAGGVLCSYFAKVLARAGARVALLDLNLDAAEKNTILYLAVDRATIGKQAVADLASLAVIGGNLVANLGVNGAVLKEQALANPALKESHIVFVVALDVLIS